MKRGAFLLLALFAFLVANAPDATQFDKPDYYVITGLPVSVPASVVVPDPTGAYAFKFDLDQVPRGRYTVSAHACVDTTATVAGGCSAESETFIFDKKAPGRITVMRIIR